MVILNDPKPSIQVAQVLSQTLTLCRALPLQSLPENVSMTKAVLGAARLAITATVILD